MIRIKAIKEGENRFAERQLTSEEQSLVIAIWGNESEYWYFTEEDKDSEDWALYEAESAKKNVSEQDVVVPLTDDQLKASFQRLKELGIIN